jgi:hypothetical protein
MGPVSSLFVLLGVSSFFFDETYFKPGILAWVLASINFVAALGSLKVAQKKALVTSMLLVFGGGALRVLVMISSIIIIMINKKIWMVPFCIVLLTCFIIYLTIEVTILFRQGIIQERPEEKLA